MEPGTEPVVAGQWLISNVKKLLGLFSRAYCMFAKYPVQGLLPISVLSSIAGGAAWLRLCKVLGWPFSVGGPHTEPFGPYAFVWGIITLFPVIACVRFFSTERDLSSPWKVLTWCFSRESALVLVYTLLAGMAATAFYGWKLIYGVRAAVSTLGLTFERSEMLIILAWAAVLGAFPSIAIRFLGGTRSSKRIAVICAVPAGLAMILCLLILSGYFYLFDYELHDKEAQVRGAIAGTFLRFAIFWGLWLVIEGRSLRMVMERLIECAHSWFDDKEPGNAG